MENKNLHPVCDKCREELNAVCQQYTIWYGYLHTNNTSHLKRIASTEDWEEAYNSDFVMKITRPFAAANREEADMIVKEMIHEHGNQIQIIELLAKRLAGKVLLAKAKDDRDFGCTHNDDL